ncbi:hypothetical protein ACN38_g8193 [Penicillium nordicum]|uniref:Uncharacterized protein n=1 Tax=Penicillium nordicum TaxID=229535 RepID=A0A0M8NXM5_9EURO|nr:hypothetical protein ACN38_g8193 [Penicillium nordicum]
MRFTTEGAEIRHMCLQRDQGGQPRAQSSVTCCWLPGCLRPRAPLGIDPLCAVDSLSLSLLLPFSSPSNRKQRILQCYFSNINHVGSLLLVGHEV